MIHELDIFGKVGRGVAHDEIIPFSVRNGKLKVNGETSEIVDGKISVEFVKVCLLQEPKFHSFRFLFQGYS